MGGSRLRFTTSSDGVIFNFFLLLFLCFFCVFNFCAAGVGACAGVGVGAGVAWCERWEGPVSDLQLPVAAFF